MDYDWIVNDHLFLMGAKLVYTKFVPEGTDDHEHCDLCWEKFMDAEGFQRYGYCTTDEYGWVCEECLNKYKSLFGWTVVRDSSSNTAKES